MSEQRQFRERVGPNLSPVTRRHVVTSGGAGTHEQSGEEVQISDIEEREREESNGVIEK